MSRVLVWDLPTRLFHWLLAGSFLAAFAIALAAEEGPWFPLHSAFGLTAALLVGFRLLWGLVGSRTARFSALTLDPSRLVDYVRGVLAGGDGARWSGHNPGASWVMVAVLAGVAGLALTGVGMSYGLEVAEELHEVIAWATLAVVGVHVAGIALHTVQHREPIALSMIDGRRQGLPAEALRSAQPLVALALLVVTGAWSGSLVASFDPAAGTVTVPLVGAVLTIGEAEEEGYEDED